MRLGDGTDESHRRMQAAVDDLWPYTHELFETDRAACSGSRRPASRSCPDRGPLARAGGRRAGQATLDRAGRRLGPDAAGGRAGTPSTCPTCSPRCRCCTGPTRGRHGEPGLTGTAAAARAVAATVVDPELRVVTIEELGILREVEDATGTVTVTITPTYSGCPAMDVIRADIRAALRRAGHSDVDVITELQPAWSTDESPRPAGRSSPPPASRRPSPAGQVRLRLSVRCPRCGSPDTEELSRFGSTACKALWRCRACAGAFRPGEAAVTHPTRLPP